MTSNTDMQPGSMIGDRHRVVRLLGKGGMGAVYEAENTWTTRRVAIKVLLPMFSSDPTAVARFQGEAQAATRLAHPNIVDVLDMGEDAKTGALYIVQEFLRGRDLHAYLDERGQLAPSEAAEILVPLMGALALAHERNIIHRDLKPENIFLVSNGPEIVPKLIDFGLSKVLGEDGASRKTVTGTIMGTPYYMSPEQCRGDRAVDARADIWAMGAVLFEMVTGRLPYQADSATLIMLEILTKPPPRVESCSPEVPSDVAAIIHRAMEPDLAKRYATLREMLNEVVASRSFQNPDLKATLRERFARSIEHRPPVDTAPDGTASTVMATPSTPNAIPVRAVSAPPAPGERSTLDSWQSPRSASVAERPRRSVAGVAAGGVAALVLLVGVGAAAVHFTRTASTPSAATTAVQATVQPPPTRPVTPAPEPPAAVAVVAPPAAVAVVAAADAGASPSTEPTQDSPSTRPSRSSHRHHGSRHHEDPLAPVAPR